MYYRPCPLSNSEPEGHVALVVHQYGAYDIAAGQHTDFVPIGGINYPLYTHIAVIEDVSRFTILTQP
jgi:hypothetical protein